MKSNENRMISGYSSVLLDSLRFIAALVVVFHHAEDIWFPSAQNLEGFLGKTGHAAVVLFFVLSGYVISFTTTINNRGPVQYAQARLSRLYSVVIPALLITAVAEFIVHISDASMYQEYSRGQSWIRYLLSAGFLNEIWFFSAAPPINTPLWSLSYEFWYYAIFGFWFFKGPGWKGFLLPLLVCLIAGPKILIMMPVWLAGYAAFRLPKPRVSQSMSWLFVLAGGIAATLAVVFLPSMPFDLGSLPFIFAGQFITDWIVCLFVAFSFWALPLGIKSDRQGLIKFARKLGDLTFPVYLLHKPLLVMCRLFFDFKLHNELQQWIAIILVLIVASLIGFFLESKRVLWQNFFKGIFQRINRRETLETVVENQV